VVAKRDERDAVSHDPRPRRLTHLAIDVGFMEAQAAWRDSFGALGQELTVKRIGVAIFVTTAGVAASCAQGSNLGVGGSAAGGAATTSSGVTASGGSPASTGATTTTTTTTTSGGGSFTTTSTGGGSTTTTGGGGNGGSSTASSGGGAGGGIVTVDAGNPSGFGDCITQSDFDNQDSAGPGFCLNPFGAFGCIFGGCADDGVNAGDIVCSPTCVCAPRPPICMPDAGVDASSLDAATDDAASDAAADGSTDASTDASTD
jgi:hypothetical protein